MTGLRHLAILALIGSSAALGAQAKSVPAEFRGSWMMDPAYCNYEGDTLDGELYITADTVGFHAEHHRVKSVKVAKDRVLLRYFRLKDTTRVPPAELSLSNDQMLLNDTWHRCPKPEHQQ
jgi:hypothetical protein